MMVRVKICGIRRTEDALLAAELGAWAVGFVFWPGSARFIDPYRARRISTALPPWVVPVGVFVDQPAEYVSAVASLVRLGVVQLHGSETPEMVERMPQRVIKSVAVTSDFDESSVDRIPARAGVLLDAHDPERHGGTGTTVDWAGRRPRPDGVACCSRVDFVPRTCEPRSTPCARSASTCRQGSNPLLASRTRIGCAHSLQHWTRK